MATDRYPLFVLDPTTDWASLTDDEIERMASNLANLARIRLGLAPHLPDDAPSPEE